MGENKAWNCAPTSFRPFLLHFFDHEGNLVMTAERPDSSKLSFWGADIAGNVGCTPLPIHVQGRNKFSYRNPQRQDITVELRTCDARVLGQVKQQFGNCFCSNQGFYDVLDDQERPGFGIEGSWTGKIGICCCDLVVRRQMDVNLALLDGNGAPLIDPLLLRDEDDPEDSPFGIQMPSDIDCAMKAVLVAFLADIVSYLRKYFLGSRVQNIELLSPQYITYYEGSRKVNFPASRYHLYGGVGYEHYGRLGCTGWQCCSLALCLLGFLVVAVLGVVLLLYLDGEFDDKKETPYFR